MNNSFDGKSFKRTPNKTGEKTPVVGVKKDRAVFTASGGETSIDLTQLNPVIRNIPGQNLLRITSSIRGPLMVGYDVYETGPYSLGFSPLSAGERIEIIKEIDVVSIAAIAPKAEVYTSTATAGQTDFTASFLWPYNQNSTQTRGAVRVEVDGVTKERGLHYNEVAGTGSMTSKITFINPLSGGEIVVLTPTNQVVDSQGEGASLIGEINALEDRVETLEENAGATPNPILVRGGFPGGDEITTSSTTMVDVPNSIIEITTTRLAIVEFDCIFKIRILDPNQLTDAAVEAVFIRKSDQFVVGIEELFSGGLLPNGYISSHTGIAAFTLPAGTYQIKLRWKTYGTGVESIGMSPWFKLKAKQV